MEEQWRDIIIEKNGVVYDYSGIYEVSNLGRVRSVDRVDSRGRRLEGRILKQNKNKGYLSVALCGKVFKVHRLVATVFVPNPNNLPQVNHLDENKHNNRVDNLEWVTAKDNMNYGTRNQRASKAMKGRTFSEEHKQKMKESHPDYHGNKHPRAKKVICIETGQVFGTLKEAGECYGISKESICSCCKGKRETAGGYHWKYYDEYLAESK